MEKDYEEFQKKYRDEMKKIPLPEKIRERYEVVQCLKDGEDAGTFLAEDRLSGIRCVIKWAEGRYRKFLVQEYTMLTELTEKGFAGIPCPYELAEDGEKVFFRREYVAGMSLCEYVRENGTLSSRQIAEIGGEICKIVEQFQELENPLVHRDIKPENLILTAGGNLMLIDFGTMRSYREEGKRDTFLIGSEGTAAPEQYGFRQTDRRTDVYAIGRTLWFLAAGCYQEDALKDAPVNGRLRRMIHKAASFDPAKRYQSAAKLRKALEGYRKTGYYRAAACGVVLVCLLAGGAGYLFHTREIRQEAVPQENISQENASQAEGKADVSITEPPHTEPDSAPDVSTTEKTAEESGYPLSDTGPADPDEAYTFKEPMIEQAVRRQLGLGEEEMITESMLEEITDLKIVGNEIFEPETDIFYSTLTFSTSEAAIENIGQGEISNLSDLAHMKHLLHVVLGKQSITDLSPLEGLPICDLNLAENQIEDFSVLGKLPYLKKLNLGSNPGENLQSLEACTSLEELHVDDMNLENVDFVENLPVVFLTMWTTGLKNGNLEPLAKMKNLSSLEIWLTEGEFQPEVFARMENLTNLFIGAYPFKDLTVFEDCSRLQNLDIIDGLESAEGLEHFPNITWLNLRSEDIHDMSPIKYAGKLEELTISSQIIFDYTPLLEHPSLKKVYCTEQQKTEILAADQDPAFEIIVI